MSPADEEDEVEDLSGIDGESDAEATSDDSDNEGLPVISDSFTRSQISESDVIPAEPLTQPEVIELDSDSD